VKEFMSKGVKCFHLFIVMAAWQFPQDGKTKEQFRLLLYNQNETSFT
jgi:hypothetical protein